MTTRTPNKWIEVALAALLFASLLAACSAPADEPAAPEAEAPGLEIPLAETAEPIPEPAAGQRDLIFLSIEENGFARLFIFHPQGQPLTRITSGDWNDTAPALSPRPAGGRGRCSGHSGAEPTGHPQSKAAGCSR